MAYAWIANCETLYNGKKYLPGQALEPGDPEPSMGGAWSIRRLQEEAIPRYDYPVVSSIRGSGPQWVPQQGWPSAAVTREELAEMMEDPYGLREKAAADEAARVAIEKDVPAAAPPQPPPTEPDLAPAESEQEKPILSAHVAFPLEEGESFYPEMELTEEELRR